MRRQSSCAFLLAILALAASTVPAQIPGDSKPATTNVPGAEYPRVSPEGRVTFRVKAPTAQKVEILPLVGRIEHEGYNGVGKGPYEMTKGDD